jgi:carbon-monoxide dehydrogenase medium subunit
MYDFEFTKPGTIAEAVAALAGEGAQALGGGQTLLPTMKQRLAAPEVLVSLGGIAEMKGVCLSDAGEVCIGGATTHADRGARGGGALPGAGVAGGTHRRPGGAQPRHDRRQPRQQRPLGLLPGRGAGIGRAGPDRHARDRRRRFLRRHVRHRAGGGEIVTEVRFPVPQAGAYEKFVQPASRFALVGVFVARFADGVRVAVTGASADGVFRWTEAEKALGADFAPGALAGLAPPEGDMISDLHGDGAYRAHLVKVMTGRAVGAAG